MKKFTIIALVVAITAVFAVSAMANEWNLYGSARMATFYTNRDYGDLFGVDGNDIFGNGDFSSTQWALQGNSRVGATVKGDKLEGRFEYGASTDSDVGDTYANVRRLFGVWHFTEGWGLKVGKDYTPITFFLSGQVFDADAGLLQVGNAYGSRKAQVAIEGMLGPGQFKFAAVQQNQANIAFQVNGVVVSEKTNVQTQSYWPKLETSYEMKFGDNMSAHAFGGYQSLKYYANNSVTQENSSKTLNSYMFGLGADLNFGPMFVKPQASYYYNGQSAGWLGLASSNLVSYSGFSSTNAAFDNTGFAPVVINGNVDNIKSYMAMLALGFSPTESLTLEGGIGWLYQKSDGDQSIDKNTYLEYYLQCVWKMAPGVYLIPEVGYRDFGDLEFSAQNVADRDLGSLLYAGAKWQIDF